jgi:hypothetical protein
MTSRIRQVDILDHALDPTRAELRVRVVLYQDAPGVEVRGRLMGPRCPYASTVEIAYPLRPLRDQDSGTTRTYQVLIPEPSLWDPESPFLYQGPVELWQDGQRCQVVQVSHGLRQVTLGSRGLRINGRPLTLHGLEVETAGEEQLRAWHQRGVNLLVVPVTEESAPLWALADRLGFLVLGRVRGPDKPAGELAGRLAGHVSWFGWLRPGEDEQSEIASVTEGVHFLVGPGDTATELAQGGLPVLVKGDAPAALAVPLLGRIEMSPPG